MRDTAILEAVREGDWGRLGGLLGAQQPALGKLLAAWPLLPEEIRQAVLTIIIY